MGLISVPGTSDVQPQYPAPIDYDGLGKGIRMLFNPACGTMDLVTQRIWTANGDAAVAAGPDGSSFALDGAGDYFEFTGYPELSGNVGTFFIWCPIVGASNSYGHVLIGSQSPNVFAPQIYAANVINIPGPGFSSGGSLPWFNTKNQSLVLSFGGTAATQKAYSNGVDTGMSWSGADPTPWGSGNKVITLGRYPAGSSWDFQGQMLCVGWTDAVWGLEEARAFHQSRGNAIYVDFEDEIWINTGGSGIALASSALASATGSAALSVAIPIIGASVASATGQGTLSLALPLAAAGAASVVGSATLNTNQALASSAAANTTGQGTLGVAQAIAGSGLATATGTGSLSLSIPINSAALANVIGSGTLQQAGALSAHGVADVTGQGTISLSIALSAAAIANAIGSGNLGVSGSFESHAVASVAAQGTLIQLIPISGASLSATNGSGSLTQLVPISGSSVVLANGQGALHLTINMNAAALAQAMGVGNLTLRLSLSGNGLANAIGSATLGGMHRPINPEFFITGSSLVRYVFGNELIRSL